ncbi:MAG: hypothetical protein RRC34_12910 [Lentisphaeria bacterium]|nr:hypothetical protein [Lentisphaeria bacterium]
MNVLDWIISGIFLAAILAIGIKLSKKSGESAENFFVAGRKMPWWLAGMSAAATSFASDSPLHMSAMTRRAGFLGCWFYFQQIFTQIVSFIFFGKLWRRSEVITELEFYKIRYGDDALALRCIMAVYQGLIITPLRIAVFILGMQKMCTVLLGLAPTVQIPVVGSVSTGLVVSVVLVFVALIYSTMSGIMGVAWTDFLEFIVAMIGTYALMFYGLEKVGGLTAMREGAQAVFTARGSTADPFNLFPGWGDILTWTFMWYLFSFSMVGGADGGGAATQRMLSCRNEKEATLTGLFNVVLTFGIRFMPWFVIGFTSLLLFPDIVDHESAVPRMISELLPHGLLGLMFITFFSAFLSSIDSFLNLGASWLENDLARPFLFRNRSERFYVLVSRLATVLLAVLGILLATQLSGILETLKLLAKFGMGCGLVRILRWFYWRVNVKTEITAILTSLIVAVTFTLMKKAGLTTPATALIEATGIGTGNFPFKDLYFAVEASMIAAITVTCTVVCMILTKASSPEVLDSFYRRIRPTGPGWKPVAARCPDVKSPDALHRDVEGVVFGLLFSFCFIFSFGYTFVGNYAKALLIAATLPVWGYLLHRRYLRWLKKSA